MVTSEVSEHVGYALLNVVLLKNNLLIIQALLKFFGRRQLLDAFTFSMVVSLLSLGLVAHDGRAPILVVIVALEFAD